MGESHRPHAGHAAHAANTAHTAHTAHKPLVALIVDDEALARQRLRTLLDECTAPVVTVLDDVANAARAQAVLAHQAVDVVFLDVHMPGMDGLSLATILRALQPAPAIVFVTAHSQHAAQAFDLDVVDYLTKPVRLSRLMVALQKVQRQRQPLPPASALAAPEGFLTIVDRGRVERVPIHEVVYLKAELKYITVRTTGRSYILDASLSELEQRHQPHFLRVHRNALVARRLVRALEKHFDEEEGEGWALRLQGVDEPVAISRRQLPAVRELLSAGA